MLFLEKIEHAKKLIRWALENYPRVAVACSFGKDSMVVLHLALQIKPDIQIFSVMTPFKPKETFEFKERMTKEWNLNIKTYMSKEKVDPLLHKKDPDECCRILKVEPTKDAIADLKLDCWITGLRNTEGRTRKDFKEIEIKDGLVKLNPILTWTELDVWRYIAINSIPVNPLYALGYRSLGCAPCSNPEKEEGEEERSGRWKGTSKCGGECGIHTKSLRKKII